MENKITNLKLILLLWLLPWCAVHAQAVTYPVHKPGIPDQPYFISYSDDAMEPFSGYAPSDNSPVAPAQSSSSRAPRRELGGFGSEDNPGTPEPIGAPWILLLLAVGYAAFKFYGKHRLALETENETNMKNTTIMKNIKEKISFSFNGRKMGTLCKPDGSLVGALLDGQPTDNRRTLDGHVTDNGRTCDGHVTDNGRTCDGHVTDMCATPMGHQWDINGTSMGDVKFAKFVKFAEFAKNYFARVAALLLMLITMSVGQVWGAESYTFIKGTTIYIDFSSIASVEANFPKSGENGLDYNSSVGGKIIEVTFTNDVVWWTDQTFIKTSKDWGVNQLFKKPSDGQNHVIVASDGKSYSWGVYTPTYYIKHDWNGTGSWTWQAMDAKGDGTYFYVGQYGGSGCNWNTTNNDGGSHWIASPTIVGSPQKGDECTFTLNPTAGTITITKSTPQYTGLSVARNIDAAANAPEIGATSVNQGSNVTVTAKDAKPGYQWYQWTSNKGSFGTATSKSTPFTPNANNAVATANYKIRVQFNKNGHGTAPTEQYVVKDGKASEPSAPSEPGWTFGGWYTEVECTNAYNFSTTTVTAPLTLYAKWTENVSPEHNWSMWCYNSGDTKIGDFTDNGDGTYSLVMQLTNQNASTLWLQDGSQHYIAPSGSLTTERNLSTTADGRFEWQTDQRNTNYTLTLRNDGGTWKLIAVQGGVLYPTLYVKGEWKTWSMESSPMTRDGNTFTQQIDITGGKSQFVIRDNTNNIEYKYNGAWVNGVKNNTYQVVQGSSNPALNEYNDNFCWEWVGGNDAHYVLTFKVVYTDAQHVEVSVQRYVAPDPEKDPATASALYVYLGTTYNLPSGYAWESNNDGAPIENGKLTGKKLGRYTIKRGTTDVQVYVYRFYIKHPWNSTSASPANNEWVWEAMTPNGANFIYTGVAGNITGANVAWDYQYDWDGIYQTDNGSKRFQPGGGYWGGDSHEYQEGMPQVTTGGNTWKYPLSTSQGNTYVFKYVPNHSYNGPYEPNLDGVLSVEASAASMTTVNYSALTFNVSGVQTGTGGEVSATSGLSGSKVTENTAVTFSAKCEDGYAFAGWYSDAECLTPVSDKAEYKATVTGETFTLYARFQQEAVLKLHYWGRDGDHTYDLETTDGVNYTYTIVNASAGNNHNINFFIPSTPSNIVWRYDNIDFCSEISNMTYNKVGDDLQFDLNKGASDVVINVIYHGAGQHLEVCLNAELANVNSGWYIIGHTPLGNGTWNTSQTDKPFNKQYRGIDGVYYREVSSANDKYFRVHNGSQYGPATDGTVLPNEYKKAEKLSQLADKALKVATNDQIYIIIDTRVSGSPKVWYEKDVDYHMVNVTNRASSGEGTYTLASASSATKGLQTKYFVSGESYELVITPAVGRRPTVTLDGKEVAVTNNNDGTYTYAGVMGQKDQNIEITYSEPTPITLHLRADAKTSVWQTGTPYIQYSTDGGNTWHTGVGDSHKMTPMIGYEHWFSFTLPAVYSETVKIQFCAGPLNWTGEYDWSSQLDITPYQDAYCYRVEDYKITEYKQMRLSVADCPELQASLNVGGGTMVGSTAQLSANIKLSAAAFDAGLVVCKYYYRKGDADWTLLETTNYASSYLVTEGGVYQYKMVVEFQGQTVEEIKSITVENASLMMEASATNVGVDATVSFTPIITKVATGTSSMLCFSVMKDGEETDLLVNLVDGVYEITFAETGTYDIISTLKLGNDCEGKVIASTSNTVVVGDISVTLVASDYNPMVGSDISLTATTENLSNIVSYTYEVKAATESLKKTLTTRDRTSATDTYTEAHINAEDTYIFTVTVRYQVDAQDRYISASTKAVVGKAKTLHINYQWNNTDWAWKDMSYIGGGVYVYYEKNVSKYHFGKDAANVSHTMAYGDGYKTGDHFVVDGATDNADAIFQYDANADILTVLPDNVTKYRIQSVSARGTFYSNELQTSDAVKKFSFFATPGATLKWQKYDKDHTDWEDLKTVSEMSAFTVDNIYVMDADLDNKELNNVEVYSGDFYIYSKLTTQNISDITGNESTRTTSVMTQFDNISAAEFYNHYWTKYVVSNNDKDAYATVGNTINKCLSVTLPSYMMPVNTNLRYAYKPETNYFSRAFLTSATGTFLQMYGEGVYDKDNHGRALDNATSTARADFEDGSDWVYRTQVVCQKPASMKLIANYNNTVSYLLASDGSSAVTRQLLGASTTMTEKLTFQITYDYKTNRIVTGWIPGTQEIEGEYVADADILFVRQEDNSVGQLTLADESSTVSSLQQVMFVLEMDRDNRSGQEVAYWFSLPFDCKVSQIFGVSGYMKIWGIQRYNGKRRAQEGWMSYSQNFWEWVGKDETLKKGEGYVLFFDKSAASWHEIDHKAYLRLFFPSTEKGFIMSQSTLSDPVTYENNICEKTNRRAKDSNWKLIGPNGYTDIKMSAYNLTEDSVLNAPPAFLYEYDANHWDDLNGKYVVRNANNDAFSYKAFFSYMVQFCGTVQWTPYTQSTPESVAARRVAQTSFRHTSVGLSLSSESGREFDHTYIDLDRNASLSYKDNEDLTKIIESRANQIYSVTEGEAYAGNTLPLETDTVALTINAAVAGDYVISMPEQNSDVEPMLYDAEMDMTTPLNLSDYTITLSKGTHADRFYLILGRKIPGVLTDIENVTPSELNLPTDMTQKLLINGDVYLLRDGHIYDATGRRVR